MSVLEKIKKKKRSILIDDPFLLPSVYSEIQDSEERGYNEHPHRLVEDYGS